MLVAARYRTFPSQNDLHYLHYQVLYKQEIVYVFGQWDESGAETFSLLSTNRSTHQNIQLRAMHLPPYAILNSQTASSELLKIHH